MTQNEALAALIATAGLEAAMDAHLALVENGMRAPTDAQYLTAYDQHQADNAAALAASLPKRTRRTRKAAK